MMIIIMIIIITNNTKNNRWKKKKRENINLIVSEVKHSKEISVGGEGRRRFVLNLLLHWLSHFVCVCVCCCC